MQDGYLTHEAFLKDTTIFWADVQVDKMRSPDLSLQYIVTGPLYHVILYQGPTLTTRLLFETLGCLKPML